MVFDDYKYEEFFHNNEHIVFGMVFQHLGIVYHDVNLYVVQQIMLMLPIMKSLLTIVNSVRLEI